MADQDRTFSTDTVEANRAAQQGLGVGQRELDAERDPGEGPSLTAELDEGAEGDEGEDLHAAARQRSADKTDAERAQGSKTRQHTKDIISRRS